MAEAMADPDAPVQLISATSDQLFLDYMDRRDELPTYDGELLMDVHAGGCYTSQGAMKYYNRRNEELLGAAERAAVAADWLGAKPYDRAKLNEVWQRVLWHQFHDDLTGTSIADAYRYSWNDELISLQQATEVMTAAVGALSHSLDTRVKGTPVVVYNPVTYDLRDLVEAEVPLDARAKGVGRLCAFGQAGGGADSVARGRPGAHPLRRRRQGGGICRLRRAPRFGRCEIVGTESVGADARKPDLPRRAGR